MDIAHRVVIVTGAGSGIGRALCERFAEAGAEAVIAVDIHRQTAEATARLVAKNGCKALGYGLDVAREGELLSLVERVTVDLGRVDIFCSNAGLTTEGGVETLDSDWQRIFNVNVMAHVYAARAVFPQMIARGEGYLVNTASAAGLLTNLGAAAYSVTKHAAVALAEWLAITYGDAGIRVSCLCPQGVDTPMLRGLDDGKESQSVAGRAVKLAGEVISPRDVADVVIDGIVAERFLLLTHDEIQIYLARKASDTDRWIKGMRRIQRVLSGEVVPTNADGDDDIGRTRTARSNDR